jgi:hypothetical protein
MDISQLSRLKRPGFFISVTLSNIKQTKMTDQEIEFLQQENERLKNELQDMRGREKGTREGYEKKLSDLRRDQALTVLLTGFKTELDDLSPGARYGALKEIIISRLAADSAELTLDESGKLLLRKKDGTNFFSEDHTLLDPHTYVERTMTRDKLIKGTESEPITPKTVNTNSNNGNNSGGGNRAGRTLSNLVNESLQAFENGKNW